MTSEEDEHLDILNTYFIDISSKNKPLQLSCLPFQERRPLPIALDSNPYFCLSI